MVIRMVLVAVTLSVFCSSAAADPGWQPYRLPQGAHDVPVVAGDCGGSAGCYMAGETVTLARGAQGGLFTILERQPKVPLAEMVYLHELGHWFDAHAMTSDARVAFEAILGVAKDWWQGPDAPAEKFAQAFALCALYPVAPKRWPTRPTWGMIVYGYGPTLKQHRTACALIAAIAAPA